MVKNSNLSNDSLVMLKFIMSNLKKIVSNSIGDPTYMKNFDEIINDIFGVKHFTRRLNNCYDNKDTISILNEIGVTTLMTIVNSPIMLSTFEELIVMNLQIYAVNKTLKRQEDKGKKKDKQLVKELQYLLDTYKEAIKALRKKFGVSKKKSYKKKFSAVNALIDTKRGGFSYYDNDGFSTSVFDSDDDDFYDEDDDGDGMSRYEKYFQKVTGKALKKKTKPTLGRYEEIDEEDDDDDEDVSDEKFDILNSRLSALTSSITELLNREKAQPTYSDSLVASSNEGSTDMKNLTSAVMRMVKVQSDSIETQHQVLQSINILTESLFSEDIDEDSSDNNCNAKVVDEYDPAADQAEVNSIRIRSGCPSKEELIDIVNSGRPSNNKTND